MLARPTLTRPAQEDASKPKTSGTARRGTVPSIYGDLNFCHRFGSANLTDF